jgi:hypothetical protein
MNRWWTLWAVAVFAFSSLGCSISSEYMTKLQVPQAVTVDPAAATVVFIRPSGFAGRAQHIIMDHNARFLGECWGETYFAVKMPPGEYTFISWGEGTPALKATVEAGKVYYVEVGVTPGAWEARARLLALAPRVGESWGELPTWIRESQMLVPNEPAGQAHLREKGERTQEVVQKGIQSYSEYDAEARAQRTLQAADGVTQPIH